MAYFNNMSQLKILFYFANVRNLLAATKSLLARDWQVDVSHVYLETIVQLTILLPWRHRRIEEFISSNSPYDFATIARGRQVRCDLVQTCSY